METTAPSPYTPTFTCPTWCNWGHSPGDESAPAYANVTHFELGGGVAVHGYPEGSGWMEFLADLAAYSDADGSPAAPHVFLQTEGPSNAELRTVEDVDRFIADLQEMVENARRWRSVMANAATVPDVALS
jgi:hypothetical protein